jgi:hypothetical protein
MTPHEKIRNDALEEAAKVAERHFVGIFTEWKESLIPLDEAEDTANERGPICAEAIRKLKTGLYANLDMNGTCETCCFFKSWYDQKLDDLTPHMTYGECWRFPAYVQRRPGDTCGEYRKVSKTEAA